MPYLFDDEDNAPMNESYLDLLIAMEQRYWDKQRQKEAGDVNAEKQQQDIRESLQICFERRS